MQVLKTLKFRLKDKHSSVLSQMACEVNQVWNYCNEISQKASRPFHGKPKFLTGFDLNNQTSGYVKQDGVKIGSTSVQQTCEEYATRRRQFKKHRLKWRVSNRKSSRYSLGWVPFKVGAVKYKAGQVRFAGHLFSLWDSYGLDKYEIRSGSFNEDAQGRWYLNVAVRTESTTSDACTSVGIDLGMKDAVTCSNGDKLEGRWYRKNEQALVVAQRANKKQRVKSIHRKIKNQRKDALHKLSTNIVRENGTVFVGNVSSQSMVKTKMAKSSLDAGWGMFKTMLEYKCAHAGVVFEVVNESYSTQTCSCCGAIPISSPKGRAGLGIREWACSDCGTVHDRDVNAAKNILAVGLDRLAEGISTCKSGEVVNRKES